MESVTDPRIHQNLNPVTTALTPKEASRLAADMIAVSKFYDVSLSLLIGIGAMENNFMNVPGDLKNTAWKHHAEPGDIVLKRRGGRVLVKDSSSGVWQITRESLRCAHRLFLWDKRDYSQLPARLRPPKELNVNDVNPLDLRNGISALLCHFHRILLGKAATGGNVTSERPGCDRNQACSRRPPTSICLTRIPWFFSTIKPGRDRAIRATPKDVRLRAIWEKLRSS